MFLSSRCPVASRVCRICILKFHSVFKYFLAHMMLGPFPFCKSYVILMVTHFPHQEAAGKMKWLWFLGITASLWSLGIGRIIIPCYWQCVSRELLGALQYARFHFVWNIVASRSSLTATLQSRIFLCKIKRFNGRFVESLLKNDTEVYSNSIWKLTVIRRPGEWIFLLQYEFGIWGIQ